MQRKFFKFIALILCLYFFLEPCGVMVSALSKENQVRVGCGVAVPLGVAIICGGIYLAARDKKAESESVSVIIPQLPTNAEDNSQEAGIAVPFSVPIRKKRARNKTGDARVLAGLPPINLVNSSSTSPVDSDEEPENWDYSSTTEPNRQPKIPQTAAKSRNTQKGGNEATNPLQAPGAKSFKDKNSKNLAQDSKQNEEEEYDLPPLDELSSILNDEGDSDSESSDRNAIRTFTILSREQAENLASNKSLKIFGDGSTNYDVYQNNPPLTYNVYQDTHLFTCNAYQDSHLLNMETFVTNHGYDLPDSCVARGGYGEIFKCTKKGSDAEYAVKFPIRGKTQFKSWAKETQICFDMLDDAKKDPKVGDYCVVAIPIGEVINQTFIPKALVMPYAACDLSHGIASGLCRRSLKDVLDISLQLAQGLSVIHSSMKKSHNDIKPDNILVFEENDRLIAKYTDFGLASSLEQIKEYNSAGTPGYRPIRDCLYVRDSESAGTAMHKKDVYALGKTLIYFLVPYQSKEISCANEKDVSVLYLYFAAKYNLTHTFGSGVTNDDSKLNQYNYEVGKENYNKNKKDYLKLSTQYINERLPKLIESEQELLKKSSANGEMALASFHQILGKMVQLEHKNRCTIEEVCTQLYKINQLYNQLPSVKNEAA